MLLTCGMAGGERFMQMKYIHTLANNFTHACLHVNIIVKFSKAFLNCIVHVHIHVSSHLIYKRTFRDEQGHVKARKNAIITLEDPECKHKC